MAEAEKTQQKDRAMTQITYADGLIRLGEEPLPGIMTALRIEGKIRYDEQKVDGASGKKKTPQGWEDQVISISLILLTDEESTCYEKLEQIAPFFKKPDDKSNPQIYSFVNRHGQARGVRQLLFDRFESTESSQDDTIRVSLGFTEHNPPIVKTEAAAAKTPTPEELAEQAAGKGGEEPEFELEIDAD
ncbi:MAG: hypothetical protein LBJ14_10275 [Desulfarculales bacterium]|jgi:hypothetical protein|nr:hypothetical protein [Desulfarculales bacterium]